MAKRYEVVLKVEFVTTITVEDDEALEDVIADVDIPESADVSYGAVNVLSVLDLETNRYVEGY